MLYASDMNMPIITRLAVSCERRSRHDEKTHVESRKHTSAIRSATIVGVRFRTYHCLRAYTQKRCATHKSMLAATHTRMAVRPHSTSRVTYSNIGWRKNKQVLACASVTMEMSSSQSRQRFSSCCLDISRRWWRSLASSSERVRAGSGGMASVSTLRTRRAPPPPARVGRRNSVCDFKKLFEETFDNTYCM